MTRITCPHCNLDVDATVESTKKDRAIKGALVGVGLGLLAVGTGGIGVAAAGTAFGLSGAATAGVAGGLIGAATSSRHFRCPSCKKTS